jgi:hypothetical protein
MTGQLQSELVRMCTATRWSASQSTLERASSFGGAQVQTSLSCSPGCGAWPFVCWQRTRRDGGHSSLRANPAGRARSDTSERYRLSVPPSITFTAFERPTPSGNRGRELRSESLTTPSRQASKRLQKPREGGSRRTTPTDSNETVSQHTERVPRRVPALRRTGAPTGLSLAPWGDAGIAAAAGRAPSGMAQPTRSAG